MTPEPGHGGGTTRYWTCQRVSAGEKCRARNPRRNKKCTSCGKQRPAVKRPAHMAALDLAYEGFVELNGGELCGICGRGPSARRRLDRDHDHKTGKARGLLCHNCNRALKARLDVTWLRAAAAYIERADAEPGVAAVTSLGPLPRREFR